MIVAGLSRGAFAIERRCHPRPIEELRPLRIGDADVPEDVEIVLDPKRRRCFVCPSCGRLTWNLYDPDETERWLCRACHHIDYDSRHRLKDPIARAVELRRKLGGDGSLLASLPPRPSEPRAARKYDLAMVELLAVEARALVKLRKMSSSIEKYGRRRFK